MLQMFGKDSMPVSRTCAWFCTNAVTDFILDEHSNF